MSTEPTRDGGMVELNFRVELDPEDPRVVVMDCGVPPRFKMKFDTKEDAKRADTLLTMFARAFYVMFNVCGAIPAEEPTTWAPGTPAPSTQKAPSAEGGAEKADGTVNATKTQKTEFLSCSNVVKLREALKNIRKFTSAWVDAGVATKSMMDCIWRNCDVALSTPMRNCDRGREAAEDAFTAEFGRPWTEEEARVAAWLFEEEGRTGTPRQDADGRAT